MTSQGTAHGRFQRAIHKRDVFAAELAGREMGGLSLADALSLCELLAAPIRSASNVPRCAGCSGSLTNACHRLRRLRLPRRLSPSDDTGAELSESKRWNESCAARAHRADDVHAAVSEPAVARTAAATDGGRPLA